PDKAKGRVFGAPEHPDTAILRPHLAPKIRKRICPDSDRQIGRLVPTDQPFVVIDPHGQWTIEMADRSSFRIVRGAAEIDRGSHPVFTPDLHPDPQGFRPAFFETPNSDLQVA